MIRLATAADLPAVAAIYEAILDREAESGICYTNWQKGKYPTQDTARSQGKTVMRFDTWGHNEPANHLYPAMGYRFAGSTEFFFMGYTRSVLNLYEKAL